MQELPLTVVIPVFNRRDQLPATVRSVLAQTRPPARITVVDDASSDDSATVARELGCDVIELPANGGSAAARNAGLQRVQTPWVAFLDSDDEWYPELLETLWPHTARHALVSGAAVLRVDGRAVTLLGTADVPGQALRSPIDIVDPANPVVTSATLVRADAARELGGFRTDLRISEDLDLWIRILARNSGWCDATPVMTYHRGASSKSQVPDGSVEAARAGIVTSFAGADWWRARASERYLGGMYWEGVRTAARAGAWALVWRHLLLLLRPRRLHGAFASLRRNRRLRQRYAQLAKGG